ncbi:MAG: tetratricopeptide repeat protein [Labilithrix sp.]|nr:tetratricopeptide repeat protein [Labilithrix sp.]
MIRPRALRRLVFALVTFIACVVLDGASATPARADDKVRPNDVAAAKAATLRVSEGLKLIKAGQREEGAKVMDEAIGQLEGNVGPEYPFVKSTRDLLVQVYTELKHPDKAEAVQKRAERARQTYKPPAAGSADGGSGNASNASAIQKMQAGLVALKANDYGKAAELLEQALPDIAKSGESETTYLLVAGVLASLYDYSLQFAKGETLRKDIIAKLEKKQGSDSADVADQYESLATHYLMRADEPKALAAQKRVVEIARKRQAGTGALVDRLMSLRNIQRSNGDNEGGQNTILEAMEVIKSITPIDALRFVRAAHALVELHDDDLAFAEGDKAAAYACTLAKQLPRADVQEAAEEDCIRAAIAGGDMKTAGELAGARFARVEKAYGRTGKLYAYAAHELALVRWTEGKKDEATTLAKRAADAQEEFLARLLNVSGETQKRAQLAMVATQSFDLLSMGGAGNGGGNAQVRLAFETILRRKGRSLDAAADSARVTRLFEKADDKALASRQIEVRRQISAIGLRGGNGSAAAASGGGGGLGLDPAMLMKKLEAEDDDLSNKLAAASPVYRAQSRPVTIEAVQATIPDDTVLVEYVYYTPRDTTSARFAPKGLSFVAFVLHKTGDPVAIDLGDALVVKGAIDDLRKSLSAKGDVLPNAKRVHGLVVAPLQKHLRSSDKRLVVSPDEDLNLVPFAALVDDRGRFLVQDYEIAYVTSGRDLLRIAAAPAQRSSNRTPVVIGNPAFDGEGSGTGPAGGGTSTSMKSTRGALDNARFPPLPGTAVETKAIGEILGASSYMQNDATKAQLAGVSSPVVLHVATHGFFLAKEKDPAGGNTRSLEYDPGDSAPPPPRTENPLVRSGLALAGANKKGSAEGLLTALEASSMALDGTRLVVLSACETGVGQTEVGDGVYGLRRALVVAGSETQVMSLWKVDDDATRDLMIAFYKELKAGTGRAAALRKVQNAMLATKQTAHPYFWAAFIPSGAWGAMTFDLQVAPGSSGSGSTPVKDRPSSAGSDNQPSRHTSGGSLFLGLHYLTLPNLRDQADRTAAMVSLGLEHDLLGDYIGPSDGFGFHDSLDLSVLVGARTSDAVKYDAGTEEGTLSGGFRAGYEAALGVRANSWSLFAGGQARYTALLIGDARTQGLTLPVIALFDFRVGDETFVALRAQYGRFLVDQETLGGSIAIHFAETYLLGGVEQMRMPSSVSLDGVDERADAGRQVTTLGTVALGTKF